MAIVALQGLRGGAGASSVTAGLAWALQQLGERVLVVDFCQSNQVRWHFNSPLSATGGWALSLLDAQQMLNVQAPPAWCYAPGLDFLPFGELSQDQYQAWQQLPGTAAQSWLQYLQQLHMNGAYDWLLFDMPANEPSGLGDWRSQVDALLVVVTADANSHIRLYQQALQLDLQPALPTNRRFLLNQLSSTSQLQQDLQQYWRAHMNAILPFSIHRDEAIAEALAAKQPVGEYSAVSLAADELNVLAGWCLAQMGKVSS
ncbi:MAG: cellulose synthase operon protein YhjQ [Candidatus Oceanisphaera merdipullorum]|nr:cellulose synthase operon protein YhjQ [Candidatus Oceanisphaera merdipullorum]